MRRKVQVLGIIIFILIPSLQAQEVNLACTDSTFCVPSVVGLPRTKGIVIKQERIHDYGINSTALDNSTNDGNGEIQLNRRWEFKLRAPLLLKENFKMAIGFKYFVEEFQFDNADNLDFPFYQNLEDKALKSIGTMLYVVKPWKGNRFLLLRAGLTLNGDYDRDNQPTRDFLKFAISPLLGWKLNPFTSFAVGVAYTDNFSRRSIFPVISYNKTFDNHWGLESLLPVKVKLRYSTLDQKNFLYATTELQGATYNITLGNSATTVQDVFLNKSEIRFMFTYEREIHDWLWVGMDIGMRSNIDFSLSNTPRRNKSVIIDNNLNSALIYSFSVFLVPPRKFLE